MSSLTVVSPPPLTARLLMLLVIVFLLLQLPFIAGIARPFSRRYALVAATTIISPTLLLPHLAAAVPKIPPPSQKEITTYLSSLITSPDPATALAFEIFADASEYAPSSIQFRRLDSSPDAEFYSEPKLTEHIDAAAVEALTRRNSVLARGRSRLLDVGAR